MPLNELYKEMHPIANKFLNPDGSIHTLDEISGGGGGIPDAPNDGKQYGRQSKTWTEITHPIGGVAYYSVNVTSSGWNISGQNASKTITVSGLQNGNFSAFPSKVSDEIQSDLNLYMYDKLINALASEDTLTLTILASSVSSMQDFGITVVQ
jgi:hypothetical protein